MFFIAGFTIIVLLHQLVQNKYVDLQKTVDSALLFWKLHFGAFKMFFFLCSVLFIWSIPSVPVTFLMFHLFLPIFSHVSPLVFCDHSNRKAAPLWKKRTPRGPPLSSCSEGRMRRRKELREYVAWELLRSRVVSNAALCLATVWQHSMTAYADVMFSGNCWKDKHSEVVCGFLLADALSTNLEIFYHLNRHIYRALLQFTDQLGSVVLSSYFNA